MSGIWNAGYSISPGAVWFKNNTTLTISACKVGRIVIVSGYGELNVKANSDIALASGPPAAAADARIPGGGSGLV